jgi:glycine/D-amino acid oxidase-like deaminating enzyme
MVSSAPRVVVVGGGIVGASIAWHLARAGARVTLLERGAEIASGVTRWSYGWVGTSSALPSDDPVYFALEVEAVREFTRLERELGPLPIAARGALVWWDTEEKTLALVSKQQAAGARIETLGRPRVAQMEPRLAAPPALAAWAPDDFAVEPAELARQFLAGAQGAGAAVYCGLAVEAIETRGGRAVGVLTGKGRVPADTVVLTNGAAALPLAAALGVSLPISEEPAVLMRFATELGLIRHLLYVLELEVRPGLAGDLVSAAEYPEEGDAGLAGLAIRTSAAIAGLFTPQPKLSLLSVNAARRPMTADGLPLQEFLPGVAGLYVAVAHPGVILAPRLGRLAAQDIIIQA